MAAEVHNLEVRRNIGAANSLLKSLVPRAQCFCFYDLDRNCVWSSDGVDDYEIDSLVGDLPEEFVTGKDKDSDFIRRTLTSGRTVLLMPVFAGKGGEGLGILVSIFSRNAGKSSWFNPSLLKSILLPAVGVIGENLSLEREIGRRAARAEQAENELQLIYQVDEKIHGMSRSHAGLAQLIGQSGRFLGIAYSVLLMPSKRIRISATHSTWKSVNRKAVDKYLLGLGVGRLEHQHVGQLGERYVRVDRRRVEDLGGPASAHHLGRQRHVQIRAASQESHPALLHRRQAEVGAVVRRQVVRRVGHQGQEHDEPQHNAEQPNHKQALR